MPFKKGWSKKDKASESKPTAIPATDLKLPVSIELPKTAAFSVEKEKGLWKLVISEIQGDKVVSKKVIDCENRAHALERFKIKFAEQYFIGR